MRATLAFTIKEFLLLLRDPGGLFVLFLMPVMFMVVFSLALGGLFEEGAARGSARGRWKCRWRRAAPARLPSRWSSSLIRRKDWPWCGRGTGSR